MRTILGDCPWPLNSVDLFGICLATKSFTVRIRYVDAAMTTSKIKPFFSTKPYRFLSEA
jgi:hypothetical protein